MLSGAKQMALDAMKQLKMHKNIINEFQDGIVNVSEGPFGFLFWANEEQKKRIEELKNKGFLVWHIVKGTYILGGVDKMEIEAYLIIPTDEDCDVLTEYEDNAYYTLSYAYNITDPMLSEYGDVFIKPRSGGLIRVG